MVSNLPAGGATVYVRLWSLLGGAWVYTDYTYATGGKASLTSPTPGTSLTGPSVTFTWDAGTGVTQYHLYVGTIGAGSSNLFSLNTGSNRSQLVTNLPVNGAAIYVRLWSLLGGVWVYTDYTYAAAAL